MRKKYCLLMIVAAMVFLTGFTSFAKQQGLTENESVTEYNKNILKVKHAVTPAAAVSSGNIKLDANMYGSKSYFTDAASGQPLISKDDAIQLVKNYSGDLSEKATAINSNYYLFTSVTSSNFLFGQ
jgi:hypothetical protein